MEQYSFGSLLRPLLSRLLMTVEVGPKTQLSLSSGLNTGGEKHGG